jgi:serine/threonine-protein kinase
MLVGQQLGPFIIDKEIGAGAMGAVYRGRFTKTGQVVAIKVMAPGLGTTNDNAEARFKREATILKQLNHPNIVRLFAAGKTQGTRYFAMEYIDGESLDRVMARRDRMTWEEVVAFGQQLCSALQHAHELGVIHRDLKPSNLMILADGTLKLTDFGIAKDLDVTQLTSANCTVGTAAYMSPEQCRGERDLTYKTDLYSLGILFYELITGRKPFLAESSMDMFLQHVQGTFERPSRLVLDVPVWLDTLICQLLEKKPEQRPRDAAMVGNVLAGIQEKVEALQSAGIEAVRSRLIDRPKGQRNPDEMEKDVARTLLTGKGRIKGKRKKKPFYRKVWFQAVGLAVLLLAMAMTFYFIFSPPSADKLFQQAEQLMASTNTADWEKARSGPIKKYLAYYGDRPGAQTEQVHKWADDIEVFEYESKLMTYLDREARGKPFPPQGPMEEKAFKAAKAEDSGDLARAHQLWEEIGKEEGRHRWGLVAERRLREPELIDAAEKALVSIIPTDSNDTGRRGQEPKRESPAAQAALLALRAEHLGDLLDKPTPGDLALALQRFKELKKETASDPAQRIWYLVAAKKIKELDAQINPKDDPQEHREKLVRQILAEAADYTKRRDSLVRARAMCMNVLAVYGQDTRMEKQVEETRKILAELASLGIKVQS